MQGFDYFDLDAEEPGELRDVAGRPPLGHQRGDDLQRRVRSSYVAHPGCNDEQLRDANWHAVVFELKQEKATGILDATDRFDACSQMRRQFGCVHLSQPCSDPCPGSPR